jgi:hypothetical protein
MTPFVPFVSEQYSFNSESVNITKQVKKQRRGLLSSPGVVRFQPLSAT